MGFLGISKAGWGGMGQGLNQAAENFMRVFQFNQQQKLEREKMAQAKVLQDAQAAHYQAEADAVKDRLRRAEGFAQAVSPRTVPGMMDDQAAAELAPYPQTTEYQNVNGRQAAVLTPTGEQGFDALTRARVEPVPLPDQISALTRFYPEKGIEAQIQYQAAQNKGTPTRAALLATGKYKPESIDTFLSTGKGLEYYEKPEKQAPTHLQQGKETKHDTKTGITFERAYTFNPSNGAKSDYTDWTPIKQDRQPEDPTKRIDYEAAKTLIRTLPKLKEDATIAAQSVKTMQDMIGLVESGSAGAIGRLKGVLAPYAEALGYNSKSMSDAQTYQLLAKTISGSMRMAIVGPGQVSNYETQLLQSISGGGTTATAASKALLQHYADQARAKVEAYNRDRDQLAEVSPQGSKMFPRLIIPGSDRATNPGGRPPLDSFKR